MGCRNEIDSNPPAASCDAQHFHSSSGPWMDHDGQDVCRTVKNNKGHLSSTRVYKFLSPPVHQVCVFSLRCHWKVCSIKNTTRAGRSERPRSSLALSLQTLRDKYFPATGPHIFGLLVKSVRLRCFVKTCSFTLTPRANPCSWHAKKATDGKRAAGYGKHLDTANGEVTSTLQCLLWGEKKVSCWEGERKPKQLIIEVWQRLRLNDKVRADLKTPKPRQKKGKEWN